jgi:hypothetical protein
VTEPVVVVPPLKMSADSGGTTAKITEQHSKVRKNEAVPIVAEFSRPGARSQGKRTLCQRNMRSSVFVQNEKPASRPKTG